MGGRYNLFELNIKYDSQYGYITGNYAELKIRADYGDRTGVDTSFVFLFGPGDFLKNLESSSNIPQYAFNASIHDTQTEYEKGILATDKIYVEGGCGVKPVVKASEIREIIEEQMVAAGIADITETVINKATIVLPYNVNGNYDLIDKFPVILSPTVKLRSSSNNKYVTYAGLTDSSIASENQGDINRSLSMYSPDISHHVQEIMKVKKDADYDKNIEKYDIWFLIMHEEITESSSSSSAYDDYYNNLMYNSYYNNMMYDPYGYGYGYGGYGYGYGYGGYGGYGYNNYYNYYMMAAYANSSSTTTEESSNIKELPRLRVTFSSPKTAEKVTE